MVIVVHPPPIHNISRPRYKSVTVSTVARDSYGRSVANVKVGGMRAHDPTGHWRDWLDYVEARYGYEEVGKCDLGLESVSLDSAEESSLE